MDGIFDSNIASSEPSDMQTDTTDIAMEDGEISANDEPEEVMSIFKYCMPFETSE